MQRWLAGNAVGIMIAYLSSCGTSSPPIHAFDNQKDLHACVGQDLTLGGVLTRTKEGYYIKDNSSRRIELVVPPTASDLEIDKYVDQTVVAIGEVCVSKKHDVEEIDEFPGLLRPKYQVGQTVPDRYYVRISKIILKDR